MRITTSFAQIVVAACCLVAGPVGASEIEKVPGADAATVVQSFLDAATSNDLASFERLKEPDARVATSRGSGVAPQMSLLQIYHPLNAFNGCKLSAPVTISENLAELDAVCAADTEPKKSYFLVYDGKVRIFYQFMPPLVMVRPN